MVNVKSILLTALTGLFLFVTPVNSQEVNEARVKELVQIELERLMNSEGVFDDAVERGIENFIRKQKLAAQQAKTKKQQEQTKNLRPVDKDRDHIFGDINAPITLIEYSDFECPFCKRFHPTVENLIANNQGKVRWVYRHFPLGFHNPGAQKQAEASECIGQIGGVETFWQYIDTLLK